MKVIHLSLSAGGGAGIAASRSVRALRAVDVSAELWTADDETLGKRLYSDWWLWLKTRLAVLPQKFRQNKKLFSAWSDNCLLPSHLAARINRAKPDIVHLHWVGAGFLNLKELTEFDAPVVWTLHDPWAFTGGCHYPGECLRFEQACGCCPQLGSASPVDASHHNRVRGRALISSVAMWVAPSEWIADLAKGPGGLPTERVWCVPNGLDSRLFQAGSREHARKVLGLADDALVLVAGAHDLREYRKGGHLLPAALEVISATAGRNLVVYVFGTGAESMEVNWSCEVRFTGFLKHGAEVARVFCAADVMLLPSLQDNLPNMAVEALASGCPVVGFDRGGLGEIVEHGRTGWITGKVSGQGLGQAVIDWLEFRPGRDAVMQAAAGRVEVEYSLEVHGRRLREVYETLLTDRARGAVES